MSRGLAIGMGIMEGLNDAVKNIHTLTAAKQKLKQEEEMHGADLKVKKAQLDKLELMYGPEQIKAEIDKLKAETYAASALFNLRNIQIAREQEKNKREVDTHQKAMLIVDNILKKSGSLPQGMRINSNGDFSIAGQKVDNSEDLMRAMAGMSAASQELPDGVTEDDIQHTLQSHPEYTRESLLKKISGQ